MNQIETAAKEPMKKNQRNNCSIYCENEVHKRLKRLVQRANKKETGRRITASSIISLALSLVTEEHIMTLQEQSLTPDEKLERLRLHYAKAHGPITRERFLSILLADHQKTSAQSANSVGSD